MADDAEQAVGTVVQAAASADGCEALVSMQIAASTQALHALAATGPALTVQTLPYTLRDDI